MHYSVEWVGNDCYSMKRTREKSSSTKNVNRVSLDRPSFDCCSKVTMLESVGSDRREDSTMVHRPPHPRHHPRRRHHCLHLFPYWWSPLLTVWLSPLLWLHRRAKLSQQRQCTQQLWSVKSVDHWTYWSSSSSWWSWSWPRTMREGDESLDSTDSNHASHHHRMNILEVDEKILLTIEQVENVSAKFDHRLTGNRIHRISSVSFVDWSNCSNSTSRNSDRNFHNNCELIYYYSKQLKRLPWWWLSIVH